MEPKGEITRLIQEGGPEAVERLFPVVYDELHSIAAKIFRGEFRSDHTLQPTALVHEAYMRLVPDSGKIAWQDRVHFFAIAARVMRQILVNHAVAHRAEKRGGGSVVVALDEAVSFFQTQDVEMIALNDALDDLARLDPKQAEIVELKFFGGLTNEETAEITGSSLSTVKREWEMARTWLYRRLRS